MEYTPCQTLYPDQLCPDDSCCFCRFQSLVSTAGSGEAELMDMMVANESPEAKLQTSIALAALITTVSVVMSTLCNKDPWGEESAEAAVLAPEDITTFLTAFHTST